MLPVSPIKKRAGGILNHKNAKSAPAITAQKDASSYFPDTNAIAPNAAKFVSNTPPASPSSPSVSFTANDVATITRIKNGMNQSPSDMSPSNGMWIISQSSLK